MTNIPVANPKASYHEHADAIDCAIKSVLESGYYILGESVRQFEQSFADYLGVKNAIGVANGTEAIAIALLATGVGRDDEVITVSQTAVATIAAIEQIGAVPVLIDIDPVTRCMDANQIMTVVSAKTRAIVPVHLYGQMADMNAIMKIAADHDLKVIEDCAQAHGAQWNGKYAGSIGHAAAFSFYPTKNLGCIGDGGAVVSNDDTFSRRARLLREYGWEQRFESVNAGINSRLDEIQAAILNVKLPYLEVEIERRNEIARRYADVLKTTSITYPEIFEHSQHAMHLYVIEVDEREEFMTFMHAQGVQTAIHYPIPVHLQKAYKNRVKTTNDLTITEEKAARLVSLPMFPQMTNQQVAQVCKALMNWSEQK